MIKYNNSNINDWYYDTSDIIKVYRNGAVVYYKVISSGTTPTYQVCYAVVDDISQYSETEFEDVFNLSDEKWYKLNNLNQYEQYGVYGNSIATSGGTSRLPQGYTEVEYVENTGNSTVNLGVQLMQNAGDTFSITLDNEMSYTTGGGTYQTFLTCCKEVSPYPGWYYRYEASSSTNIVINGNVGNFTTARTLVSDSKYHAEISSNGVSSSYVHNYPLNLFSSLDGNQTPWRFCKGKLYNMEVTYNNTLVRDLVPCKNPSDVAGLYDLVNDVFYSSASGYDQLVAGSALTPTAATTYEGKLAIVDGYEYMYSGSSWVNVGEVSGSTATLPNVPFSVNYNANNYDANTKTLAKTSGQLVDTDAVITAGTPTVHDGYLTIASGTRATISGYQTYFNRTNSAPNLTIVSKQRTEGSYCHMFANRDSDYNWMYRVYSTKLTLHGSSETGGIAVTTQPVIESVRVDSSRNINYNNYTNNTSSGTTSFSYGSTNSGKFALFQGYGTSTGENFVGDFYWVYMSQNTLTDDQVQQVIAYNEGGGGQTEYPLYYDEKADPLNNLSFDTMEEAQDYAYNNCVYDGLKATIDGDRYYFDSDDENGWVKILSYYKVEDVTSGGASGWTITGSSIYNPNRLYYDDFSVALNSGYQTKVAKVTIYGYENFTYYLRSTGYSDYAYAMASNVDELSTDPTSMSYNSNSAITHTYNFNKAAGSAVNLSNYRRVTYNNLDKTIEHTFYVVFYNGYYYSSYPPSATLLIPKEQTNENWEQVTFSSSTNVASSQKSLYIDGNYSTSGGTSYFYYRWIVGLPSGSHSSYASYSNISYCPNVTSSTFTSVAGEQRQVNYTWTAQSTKSLSFRLRDTSGNTLYPTDTVYFNYTGYNACNSSSSSSNQTYPRSNTVYVGGRFRLGSSSNRHYIYGYSPSVSLNTDYYVDNYNTYFDITYTKLSTEAVTISYTTYDPNDTETPTFKTSVSYPYGNSGSTSFTTTSYDVPYTYAYTAECSSNLFSAATYNYTASQASRTISFTLYPNNREFSTVADLEAYAYAWEGMTATVSGTTYKYTNGEWVEQQFTQYEYIRTQNNLNRYYTFNTGFYPTTANTIEIKMEMVDTSVDWGAILGWSSCEGDSCDSTQFRFTTVTSSYAIIGRKGNTSGIRYYNIGANKPIVVKLPISASTYTYNSGTTDVTCNFNVGTMNLPSSTPLHLCSFGYNKKAAVIKVYYVKIYDANNNLVKHYVPSDNNGTPCFYELINGDYILDTYTGSNHGTLTLGPQV